MKNLFVLERSMPTMIRLSRVTLQFGLGCIVSVLGLSVAAQDYPTRPLSMIVSYAPGGVADASARRIADAATKELGQSIVVVNRAGAGGVIGAQAISQAAPDGYTFGWINRPLAVFGPTMDSKFHFVLGEHYKPIALATDAPFVVSTHPKALFKTIQGLIEYAKANPGAVNYGSPGNATGGHLAVELLQMMTGTKMTHIPYKGEGPAMTDLMAGRIDIVVGGAPAKPQIAAGTLVGLATTLEKRWSLFPDLPTVAEAGVSGFGFSSWIGFVGPPAMNDAAVTKLGQAIVTGIQRPEHKQRLEDMGLVVNPLLGPEFTAYVRKDIQQWKSVVNATGLKIE